MRQALDTSTAPVIFSHSCARALTGIDRNVPDDVLERLPANGGVCMVAFVPMFVSQPAADWYLETLDLVEASGGDRRDFEQVNPLMQQRMADAPPPRSTVADVADHVEHVRHVAGVDHVGLGGDYDGASYFPTGMEDVSGYPQLFAELRDRRWADEEIAALAHGNVLRAMRGMEEAASQ
jgi:membrane dipeptidase